MIRIKRKDVICLRKWLEHLPSSLIRIWSSDWVWVGELAATDISSMAESCGFVVVSSLVEDNSLVLCLVTLATWSCSQLGITLFETLVLPERMQVLIVMLFVGTLLETCMASYAKEIMSYITCYILSTNEK